MTKDDKHKALATRSMELLNKDKHLNIIMTPPTTTMAKALKQLLNPIEEHLEKCSTAANAEELMWEALLNVDNKDLTLLRSIMDTSNRTRTEDKLLQSIHIIDKNILMMEDSIDHINHIKSKMIECYMHIYAKLYSYEKHGGTVVYDNNKFLTTIATMITYKEGLKVGVKTTTSSTTLQDTTPQNCIVM